LGVFSQEFIVTINVVTQRSPKIHVGRIGAVPDR
jgi:hypothetical protein